MEQKEQDKSEKKSGLDMPSAILLSVMIVCVTACIIAAVFRIGFARNPEHIVVTLSSEQLEGKDYTSATIFDDSGLWETENNQSAVTITDTSVSSAVEFPIDINLANAEELMQIDGIGEVTAEDILSYRETHGYFSSYDDLLNVDGIGEKTLENLKRYVFISDDILFEQTTTDVSEIIVTTVAVSVSETEDLITENIVSFPLELNSATAEELMCIDGIGEQTANKIVEYARTYGFYSIEDLLNIDGIGSSKFEAVSQYVYVNSSYLLSGSD